jgi:protoheme ferro-lyase
VGATVAAVMEQLQTTSTTPTTTTPGSYRRPYVLAWQSQVGFAKWLGPRTLDVITGLAKQVCISYHHLDSDAFTFFITTVAAAAASASVTV